MKISLASIVASFMLLFSVAANAGQIASDGTSGYHGSPATLSVTFGSGTNSIADGGNFQIGFDNSKLTLSNIDGTSDFAAVFVSDFPSPSLVNLSLACVTLTCLDSLYSGPLFSLLFTIGGNYPDVIPVTIDWYAADDIDFANKLESIAPTVTVLQDTTIPEPGALGLVALALFAMVGVGRRSRINRV